MDELKLIKKLEQDQDYRFEFDPSMPKRFIDGFVSTSMFYIFDKYGDKSKCEYKK